MSTDVRIENYPNGYERLFLDGQDVAGMPDGIDALTVLHYLRWWRGFDVNVRKNILDDDGNVLASLDDGGNAPVGNVWSGGPRAGEGREG